MPTPEKSFEALDREERSRLAMMADAGTLKLDHDALVVNIWSDERGFYWQRSEDRHEGLVGPFQTRAAAEWDASAVLYMEAGKAGIRFVA